MYPKISTPKSTFYLICKILTNRWLVYGLNYCGFLLRIKCSIAYIPSYNYLQRNFCNIYVQSWENFFRPKTDIWSHYWFLGPLLWNSKIGVPQCRDLEVLHIRANYQSICFKTVDATEGRAKKVRVKLIPSTQIYMQKTQKFSQKNQFSRSHPLASYVHTRAHTLAFTPSAGQNAHKSLVSLAP